MRKILASIAVTIVLAIHVPATARASGPVPGGHTVSTDAIPSSRLKDIATRYLEKGDEAGFWSEVQRIADDGGYPLVETFDGPRMSPPDYVRVTFLHKVGDAQPDNVLLFANINHVLAEELLFEPIRGTNVYFKTVEVPSGARFEYRIIENDPLTGIFAGAKYGTRMHLLGGDPDPFNPNKTVYADGLGEGKDYIETWVELPGASPQPHIVDRDNPRGKVTSEEYESRMLGYPRLITTYLPPAYDPDTAYGLMILFDASSYFSYGSLSLTLDNLIAEGSIPPIVVLGIDAGQKDGQTQRNDEFTCNPRFMAFLDEELIPWFTAKYSISSDPARRVIAGSSFGGLFSAYFAFNHPEVVSNVLSQSGSFHWGRQQDEIPFEWLIREFAFNSRKPISLYLEVGLLEGEYTWTNPGFPHQIVSHRHFKTILDMKEYPVEYHEYAGGHEMLSWRGGIADGLKHLIAE